MGVGASEFSGGVRSVVGVGGICQSWFVPTRASVFEIFVACSVVKKEERYTPVAGGVCEQVKKIY